MTLKEIDDEREHLRLLKSFEIVNMRYAFLQRMSWLGVIKSPVYLVRRVKPSNTGGLLQYNNIEFKLP